MILLLDNYDSFTYNLVEYFRILGVEPRVVRNDSYSLEELINLDFEALVISPGPGTPYDSGVLMPLLKEVLGRKPILGICLGMQALGLLHGAELMKSNQPMHGKTSNITHDGNGIFKGIPSPFEACRYHSLYLNLKNAENIRITASTKDDIPMALEVLGMNAWGVQFHPEAILSKYGLLMLQNWLIMAKAQSIENY